MCRPRFAAEATDLAFLGANTRRIRVSLTLRYATRKLRVLFEVFPEETLLLH